MSEKSSIVKSSIQDVMAVSNLPDFSDGSSSSKGMTEARHLERFYPS